MFTADMKRTGRINGEILQAMVLLASESPFIHG
jgi:hypothetical protein